jgi:hypothetical protein
MVAFVYDELFDAGLDYFDATARTGEVLHICSQQPTTRTEAVTTYSLGSATPTTTGPADHTTGRKITIDAISGGTVSTTGTATHWAYCDDTNLLATHTLSTSKSVTATNTFSLDAIIIAKPDPV